MKFVVVSTIALALSAPVVAQEAAVHEEHAETATKANVEMPTEPKQVEDFATSDTRPLMWDKVRAGMTMQEIHALYPEDGSKIKWHGNKQTEIEDITVIEGCEAEVEIHHESGAVDVIKVKGRGSLVGRCSDKVFSALAAKYGQPDGQTNQRGSLFKRGKSTAIWNRDGITMRFAWNNDNGLGGSGLLQSSWQMEYSASAGDIAL